MDKKVLVLDLDGIDQFRKKITPEAKAALMEMGGGTYRGPCIRASPQQGITL